MADINQIGQDALKKAPGPILRLLAGIKPQFSLQNGATQAIGTQPEGGKPFAGVEPGSSNQIMVTDPSKFMQSPRQSAVHESVHNIQYSLSPQQQAQIPNDLPGVDAAKMATNPSYLAAQRAQGKSILQLPREQQAYLAQYYTAQQEAAEKGQISPQQMQQVEQTYGPWIQDFNKAQLSNIQPTDPSSSTLNTTPRAPMPPVNLQQDAVQFDPSQSQQGPITQSLLAGMNQPQQPAPQYVPPVVANTNKWAKVVQGALAGLGGGLSAGMQNVQDAGTSVGPHANGYQAGANASQALQQAQQQKQAQATQQAQQNFENQNKTYQANQEAQLNRARTMEANLNLLKMGQDMDNKPKEEQAAYYKGQDAHEADLRKAGMSSLGEVPDLNSAAQWMQQNKKNTADVVFTHHQDADGKDRISIWENPSHSVDASSINARLHNKNDYVSSGSTMNAGDAYSFVNGRNAKNSDAQAEMARTQATQAGEMARTQATQAGENARQQTTLNAKGGGADDELIDQIGTGKIAASNMGYLLARNPDLVKAVVKKYPDFDSSKAASYLKTSQDFTSGKTAAALNSVGTSLLHLKDLKNLNTVESHIPGTPDYNAYQAQIEPLAEEMSKFYGGGVGSVASTNSFKKALSSQFPGTRDAAIKTAAKALGVKLDNYEQQWSNAAPSSHYQLPMPGISDEAKSARAALDPTYKGGAQTFVVNGKSYNIPAAMVSDFKKDHPDAR